jgi:EAL domain-containing protein (putative c-di-GMP-specific phosphodiesterase class I)
MPLPQPSGWLASLARSLGLARGAARVPAEASPVDADRLSLDLRDAIANREVLPYYQPILDIETGELAGFESLARWAHPHFGLINPALFVPIAEEIGAIGELSFSLLAQACGHARTWPEHIGLSINISPRQLCDPELLARLPEILAAGGLAPSRLTIELTESALVCDLPTARRTLTALRDRGIKLALDDFGAGHTSLRYLNELPFDRIKIDRSFVETIGGRTGRMIVRSIITLAHSLQMQVTAEGIESNGQAALLSDMGCDHGQGFLFGAPMPANTAQRMIDARQSNLRAFPGGLRVTSRRKSA